MMAQPRYPPRRRRYDLPVVGMAGLLVAWPGQASIGGSPLPYMASTGRRREGMGPGRSLTR
jgi:hypothetical protein